jgi:hypothetical protein
LRAGIQSGFNMSKLVQITIVTDTDSIQRRKSGVVVGCLYLTDGQFCFPHESWTDFPVVVLGWWLEALTKSQLQRSAEALSFMDGPYEFDLVKTGKEFGIKFCRRGATYREMISQFQPVDVRSLLESAIMAARDHIYAVRANSWNDEDTQRLSETLPAAQSLLKGYG